MEDFKADIIIYGGTSAAVTAAFQAARMGKSVIMVSPDKHIGGLSSGGLGFTDSRHKSVIGGLAREFYGRLYLHYQKPESWKWQKRDEYGNEGQGKRALNDEGKCAWVFEPGAAEGVFEGMIKDAGVRLYRQAWLEGEKGVAVEDGCIKSITTLDGKVYKAAVFIDATYEGDLMAAAGVHSIDEGCAVQDISYDNLKARLLADGQILNQGAVNSTKEEGLEYDLGEQPIVSLLADIGLKAGDLMNNTTETLTYKMVSRACKGRRLTIKTQVRILKALNKASGNKYMLEDLFNY